MQVPDATADTLARIEQLRTKQDRDSFIALTEYLDRPEGATAAADALVRRGDRAAIPILREAYERYRDEMKRQEAAGRMLFTKSEERWFVFLGAWCELLSTAELIHALNAADTLERSIAVSSLRKRDGHNVDSALARVSIEDPRIEVRREAASALIGRGYNQGEGIAEYARVISGNEENVPHLLANLRDSTSDPHSRAYCAWLFGIRKSKEAISTLQCVLNDSHECVRKQASWALKQIEE